MPQRLVGQYEVIPYVVIEVPEAEEKNGQKAIFEEMKNPKLPKFGRKH